MDIYKLIIQNTKNIRKLERQLCCGGIGTVASVGLTMPSAFLVVGSPVTSYGTLAVTAIGSTSQYIRGDGTLATLPIETANNGLTKTINNIQLGGALVQNTSITGVGDYQLIVSGDKSGFSNNDGVFRVSNSTSGGVGIYSQSSGSPTARAIWGESASGAGIRGDGRWGIYGTSSIVAGVFAQASSTANGIYAEGVDGSAASFLNNPASTNTIVPVMQITRTSAGTAADGIGGSIDFYNQAITGGTTLSNQIISKLTTATLATRTSQLSITGVNSGITGTLATFDGNGNVTFGATNAIVGTATNNNAVAGNIGEEINSIVSTYTNYSTTATYQNIASITLTPGDWDLSAFFTYSSNSATIVAAANAIFVISTTTASAAGATEGLNTSYVAQSALLGTSLFSNSIPPYRVSIAAPTIYYLNTQATFTLGNPQFVGGIRARRIR